MIAKLIIPHSTQADEGMRIDSLQPNQPESGGKLNAFCTSQLWLEKGLCLVFKHLILCKWKKTIKSFRCSIYAFNVQSCYSFPGQQ
jgi:hypothetical protein